MSEVGKVLVVIGAVFLIGGILFILLARLNLPFGRLPGDITYRGKNFTIFLPLATSILISVVLTLIFYFIGRFRR